MPTPEPSPQILKACARAGQGYRARAVQAVAQNYERHRHLPRLLPLASEETAGTPHSATARIVEKLEDLARGLSKAAAARHWSYDANRHIAVLGALQAERAQLARLEDQHVPKRHTAA